MLEIKPILLKIQNLETAIELCSKLGPILPSGIERISVYKLAVGLAEKLLQKKDMPTVIT
jgi:hypothetical protein